MTPTEKKHKKCGFRDKIDVCRFKPEQCNAKDCDMHSIEFTLRKVLAKTKVLRAEIKVLHGRKKAMKKAGYHKTNPDEYKELKHNIADKVSGMMKMSQAYMYCKRTGK